MSYILQEFRLVLDRLVPLFPADLTVKAEELYAQLIATTDVTEQQIRQALIEVGKWEYPYRRSYEELCQKDEEVRMQTEILQRLSPELKEKLNHLLTQGIHLVDYLKSKFFEDLSGEERYQVDQAVLMAHEVLNEQCDERAKNRAENFEQLVEKWKADQAQTQAVIEQLKTLAEAGGEHQAEMISLANDFEEGWSLVERDPERRQVEEELIFWQNKLKTEGGNEMIAEDAG